MKSYRCIFFDLDHTLWDYETNASSTLVDLYDKYELDHRYAVNQEDFIQSFKTVNHALWDLYDTGQITRNVIREERFSRVLRQLGIENNSLAYQLSTDYILQSPRKSALLPNVIETIQYLYKKYPLYIITNGFDDIQETKLNASGIHHYFLSVISSEKAGHKKPAAEIFNFALHLSGYQARESIMIGDNLLTDISGANNAGIDCVYYNPGSIPHSAATTYEIRDMGELKGIL